MPLHHHSQFASRSIFCPVLRSVCDSGQNLGVVVMDREIIKLDWTTSNCAMENFKTWDNDASCPMEYYRDKLVRVILRRSIIR